MLKTRYKKLIGLHAGHVFEVTAPANEMDSPMRWSLQCETIKDQKLIVTEDELSDISRWRPAGQPSRRADIPCSTPSNTLLQSN